MEGAEAGSLWAHTRRAQRRTHEGKERLERDVTMRSDRKLDRNPGSIRSRCFDRSQELLPGERVREWCTRVR